MRGFRDMSFSPRYYWWPRTSCCWPLAAYFGVVIVGTALAARLIPPPEVELSPPPPPIPQEAPKPRDLLRAHRQAGHLQLGQAAEPTPVESKRRSSTPLKLKLWGVAVHDNGRLLVQHHRGPGRPQAGGLRHRRGGARGATVKAIEWDQVVLDSQRQGRDPRAEPARRAVRSGAVLRSARRARRSCRRRPPATASRRPARTSSSSTAPRSTARSRT